jgi:hypothetical protein
MSFIDKSILCPDCGTAFTFTAGEPEFFASRGFISGLKRYTLCRQAKKQQRSDSRGGYSHSSTRLSTRY